MEDKEMIERMVQVEQGRKSNTIRLDEHDKKFKEQDNKIDNLEKTYAIMEKMDYRMGKVETSVETINSKLDTKINEQVKEKGKKWDKLVDYIFYAILGILIAYIAYQLGLK